MKELEAQSNVDTLSRWMAHYLAEKITQASETPSGEEKSKLDSECFQLIMKLWEHRWSVRPENRPLKNFETILRTVSALAPQNKKPFYFDLGEFGQFASNEPSFTPETVDQLTAMAIEVDSVAKKWIAALLHQAALKSKTDKDEVIIAIAKNIDNSQDVSAIIKILDTEVLSGQNNYHTEAVYSQLKAKNLKENIAELENFTALNDFLLKQYQSDLEEIEARLSRIE